MPGAAELELEVALDVRGCSDGASTRVMLWLSGDGGLGPVELEAYCDRRSVSWQRASNGCQCGVELEVHVPGRVP